MSRMGKARVRVPERAAKGEVVEIRAMVDHPHESGFRHDDMGRRVPRHIVESFTCSFNGREIFRAKLYPAVSTNPYFMFYAVATESGELAFTWIDDQGGVAMQTAKITVTD